MAAGQQVMALEDPVAAAQVEVRRAELAVLRNKFTAVNLIDRIQARLVQEQMLRAEGNLARAEQHVNDLVVVATHAGRLAVPEARLERLGLITAADRNTRGGFGSSSVEDADWPEPP